MKLCKQLINYNRQCSRKAGPHTDYCWQHNAASRPRGPRIAELRADIAACHERIQRQVRIIAKLDNKRHIAVRAALVCKTKRKKDRVLISQLRKIHGGDLVMTRDEQEISLNKAHRPDVLDKIQYLAFTALGIMLETRPGTQHNLDSAAKLVWTILGHATPSSVKDTSANEHDH